MTRRQHRRPFRAASPATLDRIKRLVESRDTTDVAFLLNSRRQDAQAGRLSAAAAADLIDTLTRCPRKVDA